MGFLDDDASLHGKKLLGLPVLGAFDDLPSVKCDGGVVAIGDARTARRFFLSLQRRGVALVNAVHPTAVLATDVIVGSGVVICANVVVNTGTVIGDGVILNTACTVDHHNTIGDFAHIAPGSHLAGQVTVGAGALVGIGSAVAPGCCIGEWAFVGAGSVVIRNTPPNCLVVGVPARVRKRGDRVERR